MSKPTESDLSFLLEDYDFSSVQTEQLSSCVHYEYARESRELIQQVENIRVQLSEAVRRKKAKVGDSIKTPISFIKITNRYGTAYEGSMLAVLAAVSRFPKAPWQKLADKDKTALLRFEDRATDDHNKEIFRDHPPLLIEDSLSDANLAQSNLNEWVMRRMPKRYLGLSDAARNMILVSGFFQFNTLHTQDVIIESFRDWLKKHHPKGSQKRPETRGRKNAMRDYLNTLGALRLRYFCRTLSEAQKLIAPLAIKQTGMSYSDRTSWNRACKKAVSYFRTLFILPEGSLPIHYTQGWRK